MVTRPSISSNSASAAILVLVVEYIDSYQLSFANADSVCNLFHSVCMQQWFSQTGTNVQQGRDEGLDKSYAVQNIEYRQPSKLEPGRPNSDNHNIDAVEFNNIPFAVEISRDI